MDFVSDALFEGCRSRALTIVDNFTCECFAIDVTPSLRGEDVVSAPEGLRQCRDQPGRIQVDNGPEFISMALDRYAYEHSITLDYSRLGKPTDHHFIETFNGSFRDECLSTHWFLTLADAKEKIESSMADYNDFRPHSSLPDIPPAQFAKTFCATHQRPIALL